MDDVEIPRNNRGWEKLCDSLVRENHRLKVRALRVVVANQKLIEAMESAQQPMQCNTMPPILQMQAH